MSTFSICFNAIFPIFLIMFVGYLARLGGVIQSKDVGKINSIAFTVFMSTMVFYYIYSSDIDSAIRPGLLVFCFLSMLGIYALSCFFTLVLVKAPEKRSVVIQGLYRSNFGITGIAVAASLAGATDNGPIAILIAVVIPMSNIMGVITLESFNGEKASIKTIVKEIAENPVVIGAILGIIFLLARIRLPVCVESCVKSIAGVCSPLMLFLIGAFFSFEYIGENLKEQLIILIGRLIVLPAVFLALGAVFGFRGIEFCALIGIFASPVATSSFAMAQQIGGDIRLAGNAVVITNALCPLTMFLWSYLFKSLGVF